MHGVAKPEWGTKRICLNCGARFYDMNRDPITCPACATTIDPVAPSRPRRSRATPKLATVAAVVDTARPAVAEPDDEIDVEVEVDDDEEVVVVAAEEDEEEDEAEDDGENAIEDVSELGDDDMADVIETDLDEDEGER